MYEDTPQYWAVRNAAARQETMRAYRTPWWAHWSLLAEMFLPRRYKWFVSPNNFARGSPMNQSIVDETGLLAARVLSTGLLSGLTSPTKPWFTMGLAGVDSVPQGPVQNWLSECTRRMLEVFAASNFYTALGTAYHDLVVFGSAALIEYEDQENVIHFYNPCLGEFFFGLDNRLNVDTVSREYTYTISETVKEFGLEKCSVSTQQAYKEASNLDTEIVIGHTIEPNTTIYRGGEAIGYPVPKKFKYREVYWERVSQSGTQSSSHELRIKGFNEKAGFGLRWDVTSNDAYGRSPGMDAMPATRQLQIEQRRKAEAIDKMARPPLMGPASMRNEPVDALPGGITYVPDPTTAGLKPVYQVQPQIGELKEDLQEVQARVQRVFFNDLFVGTLNLNTVRSATEIMVRQQEILVQIGPVIERTERSLSEIIERTFAIMSRKKLFPKAPAEIQGKPIVIKYVSMFAETQRAAATTAIERLMAFVGSLVAAQPQSLDNINVDKTIERYAALLNVEPDLINELKMIAKIRSTRQQQQQQQAALQVGQAAAQGAQTLSQTDVGGGNNALQAMLGTGGPQQGGGGA